MDKQKVTGLFCFDGPLYKDSNGVYCNVTLTNEMFDRYFAVVDELIVMVRTFYSDKTYQELNMKPLNTAKMTIIEVPNFSSIKGFIKERRSFKNTIITVLNKTDLIFARMPSVTSNEVLKYALKLKKDYLVEVGGCAWDSYWNHGFLGKLIAPKMFFDERKYVKNAKFATYVTKLFLQRRYPCKNETTNCSNVYLNKLNEDILSARLEKITNTDLKNIVIGTAVNNVDVKYKGEHLIVQAMARLKGLGINVEYQIVGPGTGDFILKQAVKYNVADQVKLIGTLKKEEIFKWYQSIDLYAQPSKQEGLPRSVIEAMSTGCPCVGSNIAGIPELLDPPFIFNPDNNMQIVNSIKSMLSKEVLFDEAKKNYIKAQEYEIEAIEERRRGIFFKYLRSI